MFTWQDRERAQRIERSLDAIKAALSTIHQQGKHMSQELDDLTAQVTRNSEVEASALALINGIADRIAAAGVDPAKLTALTAELRAKDDELSAAVTANTPAA